MDREYLEHNQIYFNVSNKQAYLLPQIIFN
jgi:hypothetical protein